MPDCLRMSSPPPEPDKRVVSGPDKATWMLHNSLNQKNQNNFKM